MWDIFNLCDSSESLWFNYYSVTALLNVLSEFVPKQLVNIFYFTFTTN